MARRQRPESQALAYLAAIGGPTVERLAELADVSPAQVSRSLSGLRPLNAGVVAVIRTLCGSAAAEEVAALAEGARHAFVDQVKAKASTGGEAG